MVKFYLDFDGVIANSAVECINTAFVIWQDHNYYLFDQINDQTIPNIKNQIIDLSISNRYLVVPPEHYYCLIDSIFNEFLVTNKFPCNDLLNDLFIKKVRTISPKVLEKFKHDFFSLREEKFQTQSDKEWVQENPPTIFINKFYKLIKNFPAEVYVISRKNHIAIKKWFQGTKLPIKNIYGNEELKYFNDNKFNLIKSLQLKNDHQKAFFIDDMVSEFDDNNWNKINVVTIEAGWGYNDLMDNTLQTLNILEEQLRDLFD